LKFLFRDAPVRGEVVQLRRAWQQMTAQHAYPAPVMRLLGEMTAAAALLSSTIKFNGALVLQIHGDGPVQLLVVECQPDLALRATAKLRAGAAVSEDADMPALVNQHGRGRCVITLDPRDPKPGQQPYQGVVSLEGESIAQALENYMRRSEQLQSRLWLAANATTAAGVLLQNLPAEGGRALVEPIAEAMREIMSRGTGGPAHKPMPKSPRGSMIEPPLDSPAQLQGALPSQSPDQSPSETGTEPAHAHAARARSETSGDDPLDDASDDATERAANAWNHLVTLAATITRGELLDLDPLLLTRRLFWQEALQPIEPLAPRFQCRCSRERIGRMLISLGREEIDSIVAEFGQVEVTCDFCSARQRFDAVDVGRLFATGASDEVAVGRPH
jgi:molecular chaperone Hsp33